MMILMRNGHAAFQMTANHLVHKTLTSNSFMVDLTLTNSYYNSKNKELSRIQQTWFDEEDGRGQIGCPLLAV